jgi:hypothetical protein
MKNQFHRTILSFLLAMSVLVWPLFAQDKDLESYGKVSGLVLGRDGMPLAYSTIWIDLLVANGGRLAIQERTVIRTGADGRYSFPNIRISRTPGEVRLRVNVVIDNRIAMTRGEGRNDIGDFATCRS